MCDEKYFYVFNIYAANLISHSRSLRYGYVGCVMLFELCVYFAWLEAVVLYQLVGVAEVGILVRCLLWLLLLIPDCCVRVFVVCGCLCVGVCVCVEWRILLNICVYIYIYIFVSDVERREAKCGW